MKVAPSCPTLCDPMDYTVSGGLQARILEWVSRSLLQGIFPTQGQNPGLLHCRQILYQLSYKGSPTLYKLKLKGIYLIESVIQKQDCNPNVFPKNSAILLFLLFSWPNHSACGTLFPQPEIETAPHALEAWSLNHWTAREVPKNGMK